MSIKELLFAAADIWMIAVGFTYGIKFIRNYRNYLLGLEWIIVATSGTNFLIYGLLKAGHDSPMYAFAYFLDAFSRSVGITLILVLGLMKVTHRYKPSVAVDVGAFALAGVAGFVLSVYAEEIGTPGKIFYIVVNVLTTLFLIYFSKRLWEIGERGHAVWAGIATACGFLIAATYDFVHIPGDDAEHTIFYIFALSTWGLQMFTYYRAYRAFDAHNKRTDAAAVPTGAHVAA
ncbi:transporter [Nocardia cyriacigeorgica]|uniref:Transporter n=1 Tax=Nocardia cyriacigeorgica TaxID=135487 RepID=A0A6P1CU97_9NOCA|nr:transporter [Nocardia cyriacigeorgica]MBF6080167.1 transporter [Nocardia cyriacigeorgica]MBF6428537.1 transporter [Nocardia cyriacigeorgica]NEW35437.1 transporter [Nocardia cyriacigeorgica]